MPETRASCFIGELQTFEDPRSGSIKALRWLNRRQEAVETESDTGRLAGIGFDYTIVGRVGRAGVAGLKLGWIGLRNWPAESAAPAGRQIRRPVRPSIPITVTILFRNFACCKILADRVRTHLAATRAQSAASSMRRSPAGPGTRVPENPDAGYRRWAIMSPSVVKTAPAEAPQAARAAISSANPIIFSTRRRL